MMFHKEQFIAKKIKSSTLSTVTAMSLFGSAGHEIPDVCSPQNIIHIVSSDLSHEADVSIKPTKDGIYKATYFGCSDTYKDDKDNCTAEFESQTPECNLPNDILRERACEEKVRWFSANGDQYGPNSVLRVTNIASKEAVYVRAIDRGPNCDAQKENAKFDLSKPAYDAIGSPDFVKVEKVLSSTELGPVNGKGGKR